MKTKIKMDWQKRQEARKKIPLYLHLYGLFTLLCVIGLILTLNTATAIVEPLKATITGQNRLPQSPDKPYKTITATLTAYTPEVAQTDSTPFLTANGSPVKEGLVACPRHISLGTWVEIQGNKYLCADRMNARYKNNFDIFMWSKSKALAFGRKTLEVKIYE